MTVPSGAKLAEKVTPVFQLLGPLTNNLHGLGRFMLFISFCHILGSQMHGKRLVSGGGRPAEYMVNNGSNSMWARFFPEAIRGSFWEGFWKHFGVYFSGILVVVVPFFRFLSVRKSM